MGNKYMIDIDKVDTDEKREIRRKRRVRNRILAWVFLLIFVLLVACGCYFLLTNVLGITFTGNKPGDETNTSVSVTDESVEAEDDINDLIDDLLDKEDDVVVLEPEEVLPTEEELFEEACKNYILTMSLEDKVAGVFMVSPEQITGVQTVVRAGDGTKTALETYPVGGLIYAPKNITGSDQFKTMISNTKSYAKYPLFLAVEEELGNTVLGSSLKLESTQSAFKIGESMDPQVAYDDETKIATYLNEYGINVNLGIVTDILPEGEKNWMESRSFGSNVSVVNAMVQRSVEALVEKNVVAGVKYFPGLSIGNQDTSKGISSSEKTKEDMLDSEFKVFNTAVEAGAKIVVVSHISLPNVTSDSSQCSLSKEIMTDLIRVEYGLEDLVIMTDAMDKAAISEYYDSADSSVAAIKAGADMILNPASFEEAYNAVIEAVNSKIISEERINDSLLRIYKVKFAGMSSDEVNALLVTE